MIRYIFGCCFRGGWIWRAGATARMQQLLCIFCVCSMMSMLAFLSRCLDDSRDGSSWSDREKHLEGVIQTLQARIKILEQHIRMMRVPLNDSVISDILSVKERDLPDLFNSDQIIYNQKIENSKTDIRYLQDEYDVIQYACFTQKWIYVVNSGTYGRVLERLTGIKKQDIQQVILFATSRLFSSRNNTGARYSFMDGIFRTDPGIGSRYDLYFKDTSDGGQGNYQKISVFRPFGPLHYLGDQATNARTDLINMIVPLSGRIDTLQKFLDNFEQVVIKPGENVYLTIVYSGGDGFEEVKGMIEKFTIKNGFHDVSLITQREKFSRGRAIQAAVEQWQGEQNDVLLFFCDVDIVYRPSFLQRCRLNTRQGDKVFYPIVFSLYNPDVVYALQDIRKPREEELIKITSETGFWRDFGYGMTCQYRSDFFRMRGFKQDIVGWGTEDVMLFRKYAQSNISIVRSVDHGLYHMWHEKLCDQGLSWKQFKACMSSKARTEASHGLLGMLAFQYEVESYKRRHGMMLRSLRPKL